MFSCSVKFWWYCLIGKGMGTKMRIFPFCVIRGYLIAGEKKRVSVRCGKKKYNRKAILTEIRFFLSVPR